MADKKISQLTDGTSLQSGDFVVVARSGNNFKVDPTVGVIQQADIGTDPNQVPLNQYLGSMAYQDLENVVVGELTADGLAVDTDTLYVDATNNRVGIGTTSPGTKLEVSNDGASQIAITNTSGTTKNTQLLFKDDAGVKWRVGMDVATNNNTNIFQIYNGATSSASMSIDASNNLLVGTTTTFPGSVSNVAGIHLGGSTSGRGYFSNDGGRALNLNRMTSDGEIVEFRKDSTTVGAIGTVDADLTIYTTTSGHAGLRLGIGYVAPTNNAGTTTDNTVDLGLSTQRFKNLYLSGGVYLGGTVAANQLDDYEEGTFTPVLEGTTTAGTGTYTTQFGQYTKIGDTVFIRIYLAWTAHTGTGDTEISGLPFTANATRTAPLSSWASEIAYTTPPTFFVSNSTTKITGVEQVNNNFATGLPLDTSGAITISGSYHV